MRKLRQMGCGALLSAGLATGVWAQEPVTVPKVNPQAGLAAAPDAHGPMQLNVVVAPGGQKSAPIAGLPESAFTLTVDGKSQAITSFKALTEQQAPVKVVLVIDDVNISYSRLAYERQEIGKYLKSNEGRLSNPTALAVVTDTNVEITGFNADGNGLSDTLNGKEIGLRDLRRSAGFYGAQERLDISLRALGRMIAQLGQQPGRKAIVWISPGWPLLSGPYIQLSLREEQAIYGEVAAFTNALRRADVTLYAVDPLGAGQAPLRTFYYEEFLKQPRKPSQAVLGSLGLQVLAIQSGGQAVSSSNDIAELIARSVADTQAYYQLEFMPPPADAPGEFHAIAVQVNQPHVTVRTRQGYYSPTEIQPAAQ